MPAFEWKPEYDLGIEAIDFQHKLIINKFNTLYEAISSQKTSNTIGQKLVELIILIEDHFHDEERLFYENRYPMADEHKNAHKNLLESTKAQLQFGQLDQIISPLVLLWLQKEWIENHMLSMDMEYKEFILRLEVLRKLKEHK